MNDNFAIITPIEQKEIEKQGFSFLQDDIIVCGNCNKQLIQIIKVKNTDDTQAIKVSCPYCGDHSFWYKIKGKIYMQPKKDLFIYDAPVEIRGDILYSTIIVKKVE